MDQARFSDTRRANLAGDEAEVRRASAPNERSLSQVCPPSLISAGL